MDTACKAGLPRASDRRSLVRRMYSLLHDANALKRVKALRFDVSTSVLDTCVAGGVMNIDSAPGKKRAKAIRQAGGVVTSL